MKQMSRRVVPLCPPAALLVHSHPHGAAYANLSLFHFNRVKDEPRPVLLRVEDLQLGVL